MTQSHLLEQAASRGLASRVICFVVVALAAAPFGLVGQTNPLWDQEEVRNFLPHMTVPEVRSLLERSDMVILPVGALEQHGNQLPIGTDYLNGVERAKLLAQEVDALVAPILLPGQSPYHMAFEGTITLPSTLIQEVYVEAAKSLMRHGFKRFLVLNAHGGNRAITTFIVDRINQETAGIAVDLGVAAAPFMAQTAPSAPSAEPAEFDRHGGVGETSNALYLIPSLVDLEAGRPSSLSMPDHLAAMLPAVRSGDPTALLVFLAEALKDEATGKGTSSAEMSSTGAWSVRDPRDATAERGEQGAERFVNAAAAFMRRWEELRPSGTP